MLSRRERPTFDVFHLDSSSEETTSWRCDHAHVPWFLVSVLHVVKYRALFPRKCCFDKRNWTNLHFLVALDWNERERRGDMWGSGCSLSCASNMIMVTNLARCKCCSISKRLDPLSKDTVQLVHGLSLHCDWKLWRLHEYRSRNHSETHTTWQNEPDSRLG